MRKQLLLDLFVGLGVTIVLYGLAVLNPGSTSKLTGRVVLQTATFRGSELFLHANDGEVIAVDIENASVLIGKDLENSYSVFTDPAEGIAFFSAKKVAIYVPEKYAAMWQTSVDEVRKRFHPQPVVEPNVDD